eukprot:UN03899
MQIHVVIISIRSKCVDNTNFDKIFEPKVKKNDPKSNPDGEETEEFRTKTERKNTPHKNIYRSPICILMKWYVDYVVHDTRHFNISPRINK